MTADYSFKHEQLGELTGLARGSDVVQFRGIPFGRIPARFRQSTLIDQLPSQPFDARHPGPYCPQPFLAYPTYWDGPLPEGFPVLKAPEPDEFECLNLSITAPRSGLADSTASIPVLMFIHGGAFVGGSQSLSLAGREVFDGTNLVRNGLARATPLIVVTLNYRLGPLGFLASRELEALSRNNGESVGNYGLHDQARALDWVSRFIGGFGGDPDNVTLHGTSAGGSSVHYQAIFRDRKFKRAILSSGTLIGIGPRNMNEHQAKFEGYVAKFRKSTSAEIPPVELLQSIPVDDLVCPVTPGIFNPLIDGDWIPGGTMDSIPIDGSLEMIIGACAFEQDLGEFLLLDMETNQPLPDAKMLSAARDVFSANGMLSGDDAQSFPSNQPAVAAAYGIEGAALERPSTNIDGWAALIADVAFRIAPVYVAAEASKRRRAAAAAAAGGIFVYEIAATNPFPKWAWGYGKANHGVNDVLLFDVAGDQVPAEHRDEWRPAAAALQAAWLDFCHGRRPWEPLAAVGDGEKLGPVYRFENGGSGGRLCHSLEDLVGEKVARRWRAVLNASRGFEKRES
ncbi:Alpha/Beta hydrolase protein [Chaetomidium leptoderma]|uniref:Carboxylic ester hydrolase n=1 Tax=Chaetomidium leptoderma TaxID=669021 RepID=A0AAN6ZSF8_9PEZI|nr:Alpha/Beta hydrolase protein [Chaetomidium leptoderma]